MQRVLGSLNSNAVPGSVTKVVSTANGNTWVRPTDQAEFLISDAAEFPEIIFEFNSLDPGPYQWSWVIEWDAKVSGLRERERKGEVLRSFRESGSFKSNEKVWVVNLLDKVLGGTLVVTVTVGGHVLRVGSDQRR